MSGKFHQSPHLLPEKIFLQPNMLFGDEDFHLLFSLLGMSIYRLLDSHHVEALPTTMYLFHAKALIYASMAQIHSSDEVAYLIDVGSITSLSDNSVASSLESA